MQLGVTTPVLCQYCATYPIMTNYMGIENDILDFSKKKTSKFPDQPILHQNSDLMKLLHNFYQSHAIIIMLALCYEYFFLFFVVFLSIRNIFKKKYKNNKTEKKKSCTCVLISPIV